MPKRSAGVLIHRRGEEGPEVLLVHPGGPFWRRRDAGAWQIPKGELELGEDPEAVARREVAEELGVAVTAALVPLGEVRQAGGKHVAAYAAEMDVAVEDVVSHVIEVEWPRGSGRLIEVPEVNEARWLSLPEARRLMLPSQLPFLDRLTDVV